MEGKGNKSDEDQNMEEPSPTDINDEHPNDEEVNQPSTDINDEHPNDEEVKQPSTDINDEHPNEEEAKQLSTDNKSVEERLADLGYIVVKENEDDYGCLR